MKFKFAVTADLPPWAEVAGQSDWTGLLLGYGSSCAVWKGFRYPSLYERACAVTHPISPTGQALFNSFQTPNFEAVLRRLRDAEVVCAALGVAQAAISASYDEIRVGLIEAVHAVHVAWQEVPEATKLAIRNTLLSFRRVYTTNYDLLVYWAMMAGDGAGFRDYFWTDGTAFDPANTEVWTKSTLIMYLHGALHLHKLPSGVTVKRPANGNLLDTFGTPFHGSEIPLFISEGNAHEKLAAIRESEYLSFVYGQFRRHRGSLVVFGHGLGEQDDHVIWAMRGFRKEDVPVVAISMLPDTAQNVVAQTWMRE